MSYIKPITISAAAIAIAGLALAPFLGSNPFLPDAAPQSIHSAPADLTELGQWSENLHNLRSIPAPSATCRTADWDGENSNDGELTKFGVTTSTTYTAIADFSWNPQSDGLNADNFRHVSPSTGIASADKFCQANIITPTVETRFGNLVMDEPVWHKVTENTTKFGAGFTHVTGGTTAPEYNFLYLDSEATAADLLIELVRLDPEFFAAHVDVEDGTAGSIEGYRTAFGYTSYLGVAVTAEQPSEDTYRALNAYANEVFYDYYGK